MRHVLARFIRAKDNRKGEWNARPTSKRNCTYTPHARFQSQHGVTNVNNCWRHAVREEKKKFIRRNCAWIESKSWIGPCLWGNCAPGGHVLLLFCVCSFRTRAIEFVATWCDVMWIVRFVVFLSVPAAHSFGQFRGCHLFAYWRYFDSAAQQLQLGCYIQSFATILLLIEFFFLCSLLSSHSKHVSLFKGWIWIDNFVDWVCCLYAKSWCETVRGLHLLVLGEWIHMFIVVKTDFYIYILFQVKNTCDKLSFNM